MNIETYEVCEESDMTPEADEEALAIIEELGLEGQRALFQPRDDGELNRNPYRTLTDEEARIYGALLPDHQTLADFSASPIPVRVLQVAAHAKQFFKHLEVWHKHGTPDPLLIGRVEHSYGTPYILARWGDDLKSLASMRGEAGAIIKARALAAQRKVLAEVQGAISAIEAMQPEDAILSKVAPESCYVSPLRD